MKKITKKLFALFFTLIMSISGCCLSAFGATGGVDPYSYIYGKNHDISYGSNLHIGEGEMVCGGNVGMHIGFKNVNFDRKPYELIVYLATAQFGQAELRLDSPTGKCIATLTPEIGEWNVSKPIAMGISDEIIGMHDLYFVWTAGPCNFDKMIFNTREKLSNISEYAKYDGDSLYSDIDGHIYENDIETCLALNLIAQPKGDSFKPEKPITRGVFAQSLSAIIDKYTGKEVNFSDVEFSDENYDAVCAVVEAGLLRGISESEFGINSFMTVGDALVASLRLLGYEKHAEVNGGYPYGYLALAQKLKLTNGLNTADTLRNGNLARVIVNTINANYINENSYTVEESNGQEIISTGFEEISGILYRTKGIYKNTAVVEANNVTSVYDPSNGTGTNAIVVGGKRYTAFGTLGCSYVGVLCDYYYKDDGKLVAIVPNRNVNQTKLSGELNTSIAQNGISYYKTKDSNRATTLKCDAKTLFIYNGKAADREITVIMKNPTNFDGEIRWIDNNMDNVADVVVVDEAENLVLTSFSDKHIAGTQNGVTFQRNFGNATVVMYKDGLEVSSDKVELNSVCMFYESANRSGDKFVRISTYTKSVEGTVDEINDDGVIINGVTYKTYINISVGDIGTFYLNGKDEIVNYRGLVGGDKEAGLFIEFDENDGELSAFELQVTLKLATKAGVVSIPCDTKVEIDGVKCTENNDVITRFNGITKNMPILYKLNKEGKISVIDTLNEVNLGANDVLKQIGGRASNVYYRTPQRCFTKDGYLRHPVAEKAVLMCYGATDDETLYSVGDFHSSIYDTQCINAEFYSTTGSAKIADIVLWVNRFADTLSGNMWGVNTLMVENTSYCVDANGDDTMGIEGTSGKKKIKAYLSAKAFESNTKTTTDSSPLKDAVLSLKKGDLIQYMTNNQNEVISIQLVYSDDKKVNDKGLNCELYYSGGDVKAWTGGDNLYNINMLGTVDSCEDGITKINMVNGEAAYVLISADVPVIEYNRTTGDVIKGLSGASLQSGDYVVINIFEARVSQVFRFVD